MTRVEDENEDVQELLKCQNSKFLVSRLLIRDFEFLDLFFEIPFCEVLFFELFTAIHFSSLHSMKKIIYVK